jgi:predicted GNAT family acetyltransferase
MDHYPGPAGAPAARAARQDDLAGIIALVEAMFAELGTATGPQWRADARASLASRMGVDVGIFVTDGDDNAVSSCAVGALHRCLPSPRRASSTVGYVEWVFTMPAQRRQGSAEAAVTALVDWLIDHGAAVVDVHSSAAAEKLYRSLGFNNDGPVALRLRRTRPKPASS